MFFIINTKENIPLINIQNVIIGYDIKEPLIEINDFKVFPGEIVVLTGPSGAGKTTLLKTIAGLVKPISGTITVCEKITPFNPKRGELGYIPQSLGLVRHASVMHNVMIGANAGHKPIWTPFPSNTAKKHAMDAIFAMGLDTFKFKIIRKLSGGQQRRVATARTLAQQPRLILADEFLSELDEETKEIVQSKVLEYIHQKTSTLLVVEHDIMRAKEMGDRLFIIKNGKISEINEKDILEEE